MRASLDFPLQHAKPLLVDILQTYVAPIFDFLRTVSQDMNHNEGLLRACMGIIA